MSTTTKPAKSNVVADDTVTPSSGNVFADLGVPRPQEYLAKAQLAVEIARRVKELRLTQAQAAERLGVDQPKVSALIRGRLDGFSTDRLLRFLVDLGREVDIVVRRPKSKKPGGVRVLATA